MIFGGFWFVSLIKVIDDLYLDKDTFFTLVGSFLINLIQLEVD